MSKQNEMKIISWNCQGAFRKKSEEILAKDPDVIVIQESEHPTKLNFGKLIPEPNDYLWFGTSPTKGVLIMCNSNYNVELIPQYNESFRYLIPLKISNPKSEIILFAIWAMDDKENKHRRYIGQIWEGFNFYSNLLKYPTIAIGDFNSNKIWDADKRIANHTDVVEFLGSYNITSLYHKSNNEEQGKESKPTFHLQRNKSKPYHIDYCFNSEDKFQRKRSIKLGKVDHWIDRSDHVPLFVELIPNTKNKSIEISLTGTCAEIIGNFEAETKIGLKIQIRELQKSITTYENSNSEILRKKIVSCINEIIDINVNIRNLKKTCDNIS